MKMVYTNANGLSTWFNDELSYALIHINGLQPPKAIIQLGSLPLVDGSIFLQSKIEQRNIVLTLQVLNDFETNRRRLYDIFKIKQKGTLTIHLSDRTVTIEAICESIEIVPTTWPLRAMISLICPQPYFEAEQPVILEMSSIEQSFQFPLSLSPTGNPMGVLSPATAINAINTGDIACGFTVRFQCVAPVVNPKLIHVTTGENIQLLLTINPGQIIEITTELGHKRIEEIQGSIRINLFHTLKLGSTFFQLKEKDNILFATSDSGSSSLLTELSYRPKISGV